MDGPPSSSAHLGLDLGGTNVKWVVVATHDQGWHVLDRGGLPTPEGEPDAIVSRLAALAGEAVVRCPGVSTVGVGVPGLYDPATGMTRFLPNLRGDWAGRPVAATVGDAVGLPAHLINDARAFGLAELRLGAGREVASMLGLTLGTGVGGVVALDGNVLQGHDGTAGEIGHQTIEPDGPWCGCGNRGCLESFVRADQIAAAAGAPSAEAAISRARAGDVRAQAGIAAAGRYLGIGIGNMVAVFTPDRVVIGGGIAAAFDLLIQPIRDELRRRVRTTSIDEVDIVAAELGTWAGAIGAAIHGAESVARDRRPTVGPPPA
jgi:glucokinase